MKRVKWELEEAVALFDLYFKNGSNLNVDNEALLSLSRIYQNRAKWLKLDTDSKFRNLSGLRLQLGCVHYVVTDGKEGMSNTSRLFFQTYELYLTDPDRFRSICDEFYLNNTFPICRTIQCRQTGLSPSGDVRDCASVSARFRPWT